MIVLVSCRNEGSYLKAQLSEKDYLLDSLQQLVRTQQEYAELLYQSLRQNEAVFLHVEKLDTLTDTLYRNIFHLLEKRIVEGQKKQAVSTGTGLASRRESENLPSADQTGSEDAVIEDEIERPVVQVIENTVYPNKIYTFKSSKGTRFDYFGAMANNKANGFGVGIFESGGVYKGQWKDNLRQGEGFYRWQDGEYYQGAFLKDKRHGYGTYHFKNGDVYEGYWESDMRHGQGKLTRKNGKVKLEGLWENDKFVQ